MSHHHKESSPTRLAIEAVLKSAKGPLNAVQIATISGIPVTVVRTHLSNAVNHGRAHNIFPHTRNKGAYLWGSGKPTPQMPTGKYVAAGYYYGQELKTAPARQGAMDAYGLASVENGAMVPRRPPMSLASSVY